MARVTNEQARAALDGPRTFRGHELLPTNWVAFYDDVSTADALAEELRTEAKHSKSRFENPHWTWFSIVRLP